MQYKILKSFFFWLVLSSLFLSSTACGGSPDPTSENNGQTKINKPQISSQESIVKENVSTNTGGFHYEIQDVNFVQNGEKLVIYANVANTGQDSFIGTRYTLSLLDGNGNVIATDRTPTSTDIVPPGKTSPIWFFMDNPPAWESYEIMVSDQGMRFGDFDGEVVDVSITPTTGNGACGEFKVTNNDDIPTSFLFIAERYLDENGRIINAYVQGLNTDVLQPGESATDRCYGNDGPYELTVVGWHITE